MTELPFPRSRLTGTLTTPDDTDDTDDTDYNAGTAGVDAFNSTIHHPPDAGSTLTSRAQRIVEQTTSSQAESFQ